MSSPRNNRPRASRSESSPASPAVPSMELEQRWETGTWRHPYDKAADARRTPPRLTNAPPRDFSDFQRDFQRWLKGERRRRRAREPSVSTTCKLSIDSHTLHGTHRYIEQRGETGSSIQKIKKADRSIGDGQRLGSQRSDKGLQASSRNEAGVERYHGLWQFFFAQGETSSVALVRGGNKRKEETARRFGTLQDYILSLRPRSD